MRSPLPPLPPGYEWMPANEYYGQTADDCQHCGGGQGDFGGPGGFGDFRGSRGFGDFDEPGGFGGSGGSIDPSFSGGPSRHDYHGGNRRNDRHGGHNTYSGPSGASGHPSHGGPGEFGGHGGHNHHGGHGAHHGGHHGGIMGAMKDIMEDTEDTEDIMEDTEADIMADMDQYTYRPSIELAQILVLAAGIATADREGEDISMRDPRCNQILSGQRWEQGAVDQSWDEISRRDQAHQRVAERSSEVKIGGRPLTLQALVAGSLVPTKTHLDTRSREDVVIFVDEAETVRGRLDWRRKGIEFMCFSGCNLMDASNSYSAIFEIENTKQFDR